VFRGATCPLRREAQCAVEAWSLLAGQLGYGPLELGIVLEEMGGALLVASYFATVALAGQLLAASGDEDAMARWLLLVVAHAPDGPGVFAIERDTERYRTGAA
jgi:hypothetical protein